MKINNLYLIYGLPTSGKSTLLRQIKQKGFKNLLLCDTDDLLQNIYLSTDQFGYRSFDYQAFWDWWAQAGKAETEAAKPALVAGLAALAHQGKKVLCFSNFKDLPGVDPVLAFVRTKDSLVDIWTTREKEKNLKRLFPRDVVLPEWIEKYSPGDYNPPCSKIILEAGQYMGDYFSLVADECQLCENLEA